MSLSAETTETEGFTKALDWLFQRRIVATSKEKVDLSTAESANPKLTRSYLREMIREKAPPDMPMTRKVAAFYLGIALAQLEVWLKDPDVESPFKYSKQATKAEVEAFAQAFLANKHRDDLDDIQPIGGFWDSKDRFYVIDESGAILADAEWNGFRQEDIAVWVEAIGRSGMDMDVLKLSEAMEKPWTHASEKEPWLSRWTELLEHDIADAQARLDRAKSALADTRAKVLDERLPPAQAEDKPHNPF